MAVNYGSYTEATVIGDGACSPTKPSGLAAGEMMVAFCYRDIDDFTTPSGWTKLGTVLSGSGTDRLTVFAKVADSSDAAASNFSFTPSGTSGADTSVVLVRVTYTAAGFTSPAVNIVSSIVTDDSTGGENFISGSGVTPLRANSLLLMSAGTLESVNIDFSAYAVANNNPSWTEITDKTPSSTEMVYGAAYGSYAAATATGSYSMTVNTNGEYVMALVSITENQSVTVTPSTLALTSPSFNTPTISAGVSITPTTLALTSPSFNTPTASATAPTQWTNESENSSSWTNENKSL